ncbi:hypothetical protein NMY3_03390 [Candidatus Nitrosocosmicus oleophilus]|uniref:Glycosyltransferase RgtA/B/C/D-like domain-containing protein n=1 Tax=Candidatus Nitrosocosmicus oleophilus TaxID=1353260 RepID=A0A654M4C8_9ARCH|nr:hypothetical protein NMY3_03390 [Candidatus Nitrosocosmicus oleophilus]
MTNLKNLYLYQLGLDKPYLTRITSICIALLAFFYVFFVSSFFNLNVYVLENRVMYDVTIVNSFYIIDKNFDTLVLGILISVLTLLVFKKRLNIAISICIVSLFLYSYLVNDEVIPNLIIIPSFPIFFFLYFLNSFYNVKILSKFNSITLSCTYFSIILIILCAYSLGLSFLKIIGYLELKEQIQDYAYNFFVIISRFSPFIVILISIAIFINIVVNYLKKKPRITKIISTKIGNFATYQPDSGSILDPRLILILILSFSVLLPIIPQLPTINPDNRYVGVDTFWYVNWTGSFENNDPLELLNNAFNQQSHGDRPLSLFIIFIFSKILPFSTVDAIDNMPIILSPILTLVIYFLTREITNNIKISLLVTFFSTLSYQVLIGIYAGFYANWLGLIFGNISLIYLLRYLKSYKRVHFALFVILITTLVFVHVYTWSIYIITILIFSLISLKLKIVPKRPILLILLTIGLTISIDVVKDVMIGSSGGVQEDIKLTNEFIGVNNLFILLKNIYESVLISHGGIFGNGLVLLVVLLFSIFYLNLRKLPDLLMLSFFSLLIVPIFLGYWNIQVRVLYDIPFQIPFAIALYYLVSATRNTYLLWAFIMLQTSIGIRTLVNFYLIES